MNNNYFEAHLNLACITNDYEHSLKCIARAFRIRPDNIIITEALANIAAFNNINRDTLIDLSKPQPELDLVDLYSAGGSFI